MVWIVMRLCTKFSLCVDEPEQTQVGMYHQGQITLDIIP